MLASEKKSKITEMDEEEEGKEKEGDTEEARKAQEKRKKHIETLFRGVENHVPTESDWEKYYEARRVAGDADAEFGNDEELEEVVGKIRKRMRKVLKTTSLTPVRRPLPSLFRLLKCCV